MAIPSDLSVRPQGRPGDMNEQIRAEQVKIVTALRALTAKLDADASTADTDYAALITGNGTASPAKVIPLF